MQQPAKALIFNIGKIKLFASFFYDFCIWGLGTCETFGNTWCSIWKFKPLTNHLIILLFVAKLAVVFN
jgi:hypothetical protein